MKTYTIVVEATDTVDVDALIEEEAIEAVTALFENGLLFPRAKGFVISESKPWDEEEE